MLHLAINSGTKAFSSLISSVGLSILHQSAFILITNLLKYNSLLHRPISFSTSHQRDAANRMNSLLRGTEPPETHHGSNVRVNVLRLVLGCLFSFLLLFLFFALPFPLLLLLLLFHYSLIQILFSKGARVLPLLKCLKPFLNLFK